MKGIFIILIVLGVVKTFDDYQLNDQFNQYYHQLSDEDFTKHINNYSFEDLKNIDFNPSDFF